MDEANRHPNTKRPIIHKRSEAQKTAAREAMLASLGIGIPPKPKKAKDWAHEITAAWRASVRGILDCAGLLIKAKEGPNKLPHGEFEKMVKHKLPFTPSTAQRLMKIGRDKRLTNPAHAQLLPASWYLMYRLTFLSDEEFADAIASGRIRPDMERDGISERDTIDPPEPSAESASVATVAARSAPLTHEHRTRLGAALRLEAQNEAGRAHRIADLLEQIEKLADPATIDALCELLNEPNNTDRLPRIARAIAAIRQLEAKLLTVRALT